MLSNNSVGRDLIIALGSQRSKSREALANKIISETLAATFVDISRMTFIAFSDDVRRINIRNYDQFKSWAIGHLEDCEAQITRFSNVLSDETIQKSRALEKRLNFLINRLSDVDNPRVRPPFMFGEAARTAGEIHELCLSAPAPLYLETMNFIEALFENVPIPRGDFFDKNYVDGLAQIRFRMQNASIDFLREHFGIEIQTIAEDMELQLSVVYFSIDHILLRESTGAS